MKKILKETIDKISNTKMETSRQKMIRGFTNNYIPLQSDTNLAIPSHRTSKWISFEEFKGLIASGETLKSLSSVYSRHLMAFYSYLSQGKINLTKEQFIEKYDKGVSIEEIGKSSNIPREHMTYLREYYGIKRKGATYQKRINKEVPLSQEAKDVIIGSLLGDGHITKWGYFSEKHSPAQLEYLKWKASFFKDITTDKSWSYYEAIDNRSGTLIKTHSFRTTAHGFMYEMRNKFYKEINKKWTKIIPEDIENLINEKILAIWFMDDGCTDWKYRNKIKMTIGSLPSCKICTDSFSKKENEILSLAIFNKFKIKPKIKIESRNKFRLKFSTVDSVKLMQIIKPYCHSNLLYKVDENTYMQSHK